MVQQTLNMLLVASEQDPKRAPSSRQLTIPLRFPESHCVATLHGEENQTILQIACRFMNSQDSGVFYLSSGAGQGKTHFMKAVCAEAIQEGLNCAYLPLKERKLLSPDLLDGLEAYDVLAFDDFQLVKGKEPWEDSIFHLINRVIYATHCKIFISASTPPHQLGIKLPDLASRLYWGHLYNLKPLSKEETLLALQQRADGKGLSLERTVAHFFYNKFEGSNKKLFAALDQLDQASLSSQRRLTIPFIKSVLHL